MEFKRNKLELFYIYLDKLLTSQIELEFNNTYLSILTNLCIWIEISDSPVELKEKVKAVSQKFKLKDKIVQTCVYCQEELSLEKWPFSSTCQNGHIQGRCNMTLQILGSKALTCNRCLSKKIHLKGEENEWLTQSGIFILV